MKKSVCRGGRTRNGFTAGVVVPVGLMASAGSVLGQYAVEVKRYESGTGFATEFGTGTGYTTPASILGEPSRVTPGMFGGPVDPFNAPYLIEQVLSVGTGGVVEVRLDTPIRRDALNPHGIDFLVFGAAGFVITNGDYSGGGITDGSLYRGGTAEARVSVSVDGLQYFTLDGSLSPVLDAMFPTDGTGGFTVPVDPTLNAAQFSGLGLSGIRALYGGSGGGAGFSLGWARDGVGSPVALDSVGYVRIEVTSGQVLLDGVAAVRPVPEASTWVLLGIGSLALVGWTRRNGIPAQR